MSKSLTSPIFPYMAVDSPASQISNAVKEVSGRLLVRSGCSQKTTPASGEASASTSRITADYLPASVSLSLWSETLLLGTCPGRKGSSCQTTSLEFSS